MKKVSKDINNNNNNNLRLIWLRQSAQPYIRFTTYDIQQSATQGGNDTHACDSGNNQV